MVTRINENCKMTTNEYYQKLNELTNEIFNGSITDSSLQNRCTELKSNINSWYHIISKNNESSKMLLSALEELDISCLLILQGLYRNGFASLRLCLEMIVGSIYFSSNDMEYREWLNGDRDLIWAKLNCSENGVFSKRYTKAYFPELSGIDNSMIEETKQMYRNLSEMVHGNSNTWDYENPKLKFSHSLTSLYYSLLAKMGLILNYSYSLRFLTTLNVEEKEELEHYINNYLGHIVEIRKYIGGPVSE